jgi:hypothetical protein
MFYIKKLKKVANFLNTRHHTKLYDASVADNSEVHVGIIGDIKLKITNFGVATSTMMLIPSFIKIRQLVQTLLGHMDITP